LNLGNELIALEATMQNRDHLLCIGKEDSVSSRPDGTRFSISIILLFSPFKSEKTLKINKNMLKLKVDNCK